MAGLRTSNLNLLPCTAEEDSQSPTPPTPVIGTTGTVLSSHSSRCAFDQASAAQTGILRMEACGLIYRMWRASFEVFGSKGFKRVHLQVKRGYRPFISPFNCENVFNFLGTKTIFFWFSWIVLQSLSF